jgi:WD40 repeat protein
MSALNVDTRTDIYALGVLLYELLTGRTPFDADTLIKAGFEEMRRLIREQEPPKPSTALHTLAANVLTEVARHRQSAPPALIHALRGDLDWIVMKALDKDRARRYETANSFARDVQHHLRCEPVTARPPTQLYRFCKFARRKPAVAALVGVSGLAVLALIGAAVAQVAFHSEQVQRKKMEAAFRDTEHARKAEETQRKQKEAALVEAERARQAEAEARGEEARQRHLADAALAKAERNGYFRRIAFAQREWEASNLTSAEELLDECPAELRSWEWHYLKRLCHSEFLTLSGFANDVLRVAVTANGHYIAAVNVDGALKVWDATTGLEDLAFGVEQQKITSVAFNPSGTYLATGNRDALVDLWDVRKGMKLWRYKGRYNCRSLAYTADGTRLVSAGSDGTIKILDVSTGESPEASLTHGQEINSVVISSDGKLIASGSGVPESETSTGERVPEKPGTIKVWEASTGQVKFTLDNVGVVHSLGFSPDGRTLASGHSDGTVKLWGVRDAAGTLRDVNTGSLQESTFRGHLGGVFSVAFSADGSRLVSGSADRTVKIWMLSNKGESVTYRGHKGEVHGVAFTGDGRRAVSASADGTLKVWDVTSPQEASTLSGGKDTLAFSPTGRLLASGGDVWNVSGGDVKKDGNKSEPSSSSVPGYSRVRFSPDGKFFASSSNVWNGVAISPDGKIIARGAKRSVKLLNLGSETEVGSLEIITQDKSPGIYDLAFSPDGKLLALATGDYAVNGHIGPGAPGEVQIWDWKTPRLFRTLRARRFCVWSVAFSPDSKRLASSGGWNSPKAGVSPGEVQVWNVESGEEIFNLNVPDNAFSVAFSPDGKRLIAANGKRSSSRGPRELKIWDMETGLVAFTLRGFDRAVYDVAFSPDGKRIATVGNGTLKVFDAEKTEFDALAGLNRAYERYSEVLVDTKASPKARANALLNRSQVLRHLNRPAEAEADSRQAGSLLGD